MTHIEQAAKLSNKVFDLIRPLARQKLNPGIVAHALIYSALRLLLSCSIRLVPHVTQGAANLAFGEMMDDICKIIHDKFHKLGIPVSGVGVADDVNDPPTNPFHGN